MYLFAKFPNANEKALLIVATAAVGLVFIASALLAVSAPVPRAYRQIKDDSTSRTDRR